MAKKHIADGEQEEPSPLSRTRNVDDAVLERTMELFQARSSHPLSREDARQMVENISGFFGILAEWQRKA